MAEKDTELTDDLLVAFADEELEDDEMERLSPLIAADPEATRKVRDFRESGEQLRVFFSVDTPEVTPDHIAEKIRTMDGPASENVISLTSYRARLSQGIKSITSGPGLQKIAASLFVGLFLGVGGTSYFGEMSGTGSTTSSNIQLRGIEKQDLAEDNDAGPRLVLTRGNDTFLSGSTIETGQPYVLRVKTKKAGKISINYYENNEDPQNLLSDRMVNSGDVIQIPNPKTGITIDTTAVFVTFELISETGGKVRKRYFVFGIR